MSTEKIRQRLNQIQTNLRQAVSLGFALNEAETERLIVEPILEALGYGPLDYSKRAMGMGADYPDYIILPFSERKWCLEVKEWERRLDVRNERQAVNYANNNGAQWAVLTNGKSWWLYNTHVPGDLRDMRVYQIDDVFSAGEAVSVLTRLSRESVEGGELDREYRTREVRTAVNAFLASGNKSLLRIVSKAVSEDLDRHITQEDVEAALASIVGVGPPLEPGPPDEPEKPEFKPPVTLSESMTLSQLAENKRELSHSKPTAVRLPSNEETAVGDWRDLAEVVVSWALSQVEEPKLPYTGTRGRNYFLNREPMHSNGKPMKANRCLNHPSGPIYIDVHQSAASFVTRISALCTDMGLDPTSIVVQLRGD